jgi:hypothetical protein
VTVDVVQAIANLARDLRATGVDLAAAATRLNDSRINLADAASGVVLMAPALASHTASIERLLGGLPSMSAHPTGPALPAVEGVGSLYFHGEDQVVTVAHLERLREGVHKHVGATWVRRRMASGRPARSLDPDAHGHGAAQNFVDATRLFFRTAVKLGLTATDASEALGPARKPPSRKNRPFSDSELADLEFICTSTGDDPELDSLLFTFYRRYGRREAARNLQRTNLLHHRQAIQFSQKGGNTHTLPAASTLLRDLDDFAVRRGAGANGAVFRLRSGRPMGDKRIDQVFDRLKRNCAWAAAEEASVHWFRHTLAQQVTDAFDDRVAAAWLDHSTAGGPVTWRYLLPPTFAELCRVHLTLFGPLDRGCEDNA